MVHPLPIGWGEGWGEGWPFVLRFMVRMQVRKEQVTLPEAGKFLFCFRMFLNFSHRLPMEMEARQELSGPGKVRRQRFRSEAPTMESQLDEFVITATRDVFSTMLGWTIETLKESRVDFKPRPFGLQAINGNIGFGGWLTGSLFFSVSEEFAECMCQQILGDHAGALVVSDVIGEITNMLGGGCKARLCDAGHYVVMSIPNVIRGQKLLANGMDVQFVIHRPFSVPALNQGFDVILLGKLGT